MSKDQIIDGNHELALLSAMVDRYKRTVRSILEVYRDAAADAAEKFNEKTLQKVKGELAADAKARIEAADKDFCGTLQDSAEVFRDALRQRVGSLGNPEVIQALRLFKEFAVPVSAVEVERLVQEARGDLTTLRMIQALAGASGIKIDIPDVGALVADVQRLEKLSRRIPMGWAPHDLAGVAAEIFPTQIIYAGNGSKAGYGEAADAKTFFLSSGVLNSLVNDYGAIEKRWKLDAPVKVTELPRVAETARQRREEEARAAAIVRQYTGDETAL